MNVNVGDVLYYQFSSRQDKYAKVIDIHYQSMLVQTVEGTKTVEVAMMMFSRIFYYRIIGGQSEVWEWGTDSLSFEGWTHIQKDDAKHKEAVQLINMVCL